MLIFSLRVRAGRLSFVDLFFPYIDVASHVFVVSVMCFFKKVNPRKRPSIFGCIGRVRELANERKTACSRDHNFFPDNILHAEKCMPYPGACTQLADITTREHHNKRRFSRYHPLLRVLVRADSNTGKSW